MLIWLALFFAMGVVGTWLARRYALQRQLLDEPGERRSHSVATPRGGGIAIVVATLVAAIALAVRFPGDALLLGAFAIGLVAVAAVGWVDDHRPLSPWLRLLVHVAASGMFGAALVVTGEGFWPGVVAAATIVVLTNVWNFMDGIDGLAASQAMLVAVGLAVASGGAWAILAWALFAACLGFLPYNFPRARVFLGDVGSGALGFALAALTALTALMWTGSDPQPVLLLLPLAPFLIDASLTLLCRVVRGERWWTPHTQHIYQVWARRKGHAFITLAYGMTSAAALMLMLLVWNNGVFYMAITLVAWYTSGAFLWLLLQRGREIRSDQVQRSRE